MFRIAVFFFAISAVALARPCREKLVAEGLASLLEAGSVETLAPLDEVLRDHLVRLSEGELSDRGFRTLAHLLAAHLPLEIDRPLDAYDTEFLAQIAVSTWWVRFRYRDFLKSHPLGRLVLAHEVAHLVHALNRWNLPILSTRLVWRVLFRPSGLLEEERWAFRSEWDFVHAAYTVADLPRLRELYPATLPESARAVLVRHGIFRAVEEGGELRLMADGQAEQLRRTVPEVEEALAVYRWTAMNEEFLTTVERALSQPRDAYVEGSLHEHYHREQRRNEVRVAAGLGVVCAFVAALVSAAAH